MLFSCIYRNTCMKTDGGSGHVPPRRIWCCRHPGGFQGRAEPAFGERPCLQGLVSYTFRRTADAKGGCGLWASSFHVSQGGEFCEPQRAECFARRSPGDDLTAVRSFPGRCAGRYINPPSRRSDHVPFIRCLRKKFFINSSRAVRSSFFSRTLER